MGGEVAQDELSQVHFALTRLTRAPCTRSEMPDASSLICCPSNLAPPTPPANIPSSLFFFLLLFFYPCRQHKRKSLGKSVAHTFFSLNANCLFHWKIPFCFFFFFFSQKNTKNNVSTEIRRNKKHMTGNRMIAVTPTQRV